MLGRNLHSEGGEAQALLPRAVGAHPRRRPEPHASFKSAGQLPSRYCRGRPAHILLCSRISSSLHPITTLRAAGCSVPAWYKGVGAPRELQSNRYVYFIFTDRNVREDSSVHNSVTISAERALNSHFFSYHPTREVPGEGMCSQERQTVGTLSTSPRRELGSLHPHRRRAATPNHCPNGVFEAPLHSAV